MSKQHNGHGAYPHARGVGFLIFTLIGSVLTVVLGILGRSRPKVGIGDPAGPMCWGCRGRVHTLDVRCPHCDRVLGPVPKWSAGKVTRGPRPADWEIELLGEYADIHGILLPEGPRGMEMLINVGLMSGGLLRRATGYYGGVIWPKRGASGGFPGWEILGDELVRLLRDIGPHLTGDNLAVWEVARRPKVTKIR